MRGEDTTKVARLLEALRSGPKTNRELCEIVDDIGPYIARTCAKLRQRGLVINTAPPGRGHAALYEAVRTPTARGA